MARSQGLLVVKSLLSARRDKFGLRRTQMLNMSRRRVLASAAVAAAFGLSTRLEFVGLAHSETPLEPTNGVYKYKVGDMEVTAVYDGIWRKPHDPAFIKNASVEDTKEALAKAGLTTEFMPIPLKGIVLK